MIDKASEITGIDSARAIENNGCSIEDYQDSLDMYYRTIDSKAESIKEALDSGNLENFTILVHALKSSSRLIGAFNLGEQAYQLELLGKSGDYDEASRLTPDLLQKYLELKLLLEPYVTQSNPTETIDRMDLIFLLGDLRDYLADNDIVFIQDCIEQLNNCYYNDAVSELTKKIVTLTDNIEYAQCIELINDFLNDFTGSSIQH